MKKKNAIRISLSLAIFFLLYCIMHIPEKTEETLAIFVHIPKTAGEAFKRNIEASYPSNQFTRTSFTYGEPYYDSLHKTVRFYEGIDHFQTNIAFLRAKERKKIRCLGGHDSYFGIHKLFTQKPKYITFIRDPIDRTISLYNFERMACDIYLKKIPSNPFEESFSKRLKNHFLIDGKIPDFETWLDKTYDQKHPFYFSMAKYLKYLGFSTDSLDQFAYVGLSDSYEEDVLFLYHELQVNRFYADKNTSTQFVVKNQLKNRVLEKIKEKNQEDFRLYQLAIEKNQTFKKERKDFDQIVSFMQRKKKLFFVLEPGMHFIKRILRKGKNLIGFQIQFESPFLRASSFGILLCFIPFKIAKF